MSNRIKKDLKDRGEGRDEKERKETRNQRPEASSQGHQSQLPGISLTGINRALNREKKLEKLSSDQEARKEEERARRTDAYVNDTVTQYVSRVYRDSDELLDNGPKNTPTPSSSTDSSQQLGSGLPNQPTPFEISRDRVVTITTAYAPAPRLPEPSDDWNQQGQPATTKNSVSCLIM